MHQLIMHLISFQQVVTANATPVFVVMFMLPHCQAGCGNTDMGVL